jgi:large subunit ribosomal protein L6
MSRIGKNPVPIPKGVQVEISGQTLRAKGPKGELVRALSDQVDAKVENNVVLLAPRETTRRARAQWGTERSLTRNMLEGVAKGYNTGLEISGVGFRGNVQGRQLVLQLGFSHDVVYPIPEGIDIKVEKQTQILISGPDREKVGQVAAEIRAFRKPEPYKGKGVRYTTEKVRRKEGKKK